MQSSAAEGDEITYMVFVEKDSFRNLRRLPTDTFRSIPRLPRLPVAASDLVAWYPFRSGTGEDLTAGDSRFGDTTDYSAVVNGATFQASGGVTDIETGANSGAFDFDGTDDTLDLGTVADSNQSFTVMTWVKPDDVTQSFMRILTKIDGDNRQDGDFFILLNANDKPAFELIQNDIRQGPTLKNTLTQGEYVHIAARYGFQNGAATIFRDGQPVDSVTVGQVPASSNQPWRIGEDNPPSGGDNFLDGTVDGTRIYTTALSDSQINQIYLNTEP